MGPNARKKIESLKRKTARFVTGNPQKRNQDHLPDLLTLSRWTDTWCMEFNTGKCYVLHVQMRSQKKNNVSIPYTMK